MTRLLLTLALCSLLLPPARAQETAEPDPTAALRKLDEQIDAKAKELTQLQQQLESLRTQRDRMRQAVDKPDDKVFHATADLLASLPADKHPEPGSDREPERVAANRWLAKHVVGKTIELKATVSNVTIYSIANDQFVVTFELDYPKVELKGQIPAPTFLAWGGKAALGEQPVQTRLHLLWQGNGRTVLRFQADDALARQIREKKGQEITLLAELSMVSFHYDEKANLSLYLLATPLAIDDVQLASRAK